MRVLVYEWCCATAREDSSRAVPLAAEGWAMLSAALDDFRRIPGADVVTVLNEGSNEPDAFRTAAADCDYALVIAPEFGGILERRFRWAVEAGATLLGPSPQAVALTADKLALAEHFQRHGVPTPETWELFDPSRKRKRRSDLTVAYASGSDGLVVKPRYGAGSQDTYLISADTIVQPFVAGQPASVSFLIGPRQTIPLLPASQDISDDGHFHYRGGSAPLPPELAERAVGTARRAVESIAGLTGYVGVDIILSDDGDQVIEVNPRLTTSYVGLRVLTPDNLMERLLQIVRGEPVTEPRWSPGTVRWTPDGTTDIATA
jgi:predicted ATP-grasp superfamily ATP-dependent carboligase